MRYSYDEGLIDLARGEVIDYQTLLGELLTFVSEDAEALGCTAEIESLHKILGEGTSAHNQIRVFNDGIKAGLSSDEALREVVDWLIDKTVEDL